MYKQSLYKATCGVVLGRAAEDLLIDGSWQRGRCHKRSIAVSSTCLQCSVNHVAYMTRHSTITC